MNLREGAGKHDQAVIRIGERKDVVLEFDYIVCFRRFEPVDNARADFSDWHT
jgi:hypothetical protein